MIALAGARPRIIAAHLHHTSTPSVYELFAGRDFLDPDDVRAACLGSRRRIRELADLVRKAAADRSFGSGPRYQAGKIADAIDAIAEEDQ